MKWPQLNKDEKYRIILRDSNYSKSKEFVRRNFTGGFFPIPLISKKCFCCNVATNQMKSINPILNNQELIEPFELPVCEQCASHAFADIQKVLIGGILMVLGFIGMIIAAILLIKDLENWIGANALIILSLFSAFTGYKIWKKQNAKSNLTLQGHHPGATCMVRHHSELIIETNNTRIIQEIINNQKAQLFYLGKSSEKLQA